MRPLTACEACRSRRRKCDIPFVGSPCSYCIRRKKTCSAASTSPNGVDGAYPLAGFNGTNVGNYSSSSSTSTCVAAAVATENHLGQLSVVQRVDLVKLYFDFVHDIFHSLFQRAAVIEDVLEGRCPEVLVMGMISLSARFSTDPFFTNVNPKFRGELFAQNSERLLNLRDISLTTIQACVLLGACAITEGGAEAESVYYSAACRMAQLLDLPNRAISSELEREVNLRVWWTLCMIDVWSSAGVRLPTMMVRRLDCPLPMDELTFLRLTPRDAPDHHNLALIHGSPSSLLAQMIKLNTILLEVNIVNERAVESHISAPQIADLVATTSQKLDDWYNLLPGYMHDTPENLAYYASQGLGRLFVAVYLGYYHYRQLLYYQFLHKDSFHEAGYESMPSARFYAAKCKTSAANLCTLLYAANSTPGCEMLHTMLGHVLVISSTVQIHTLMFDDDESAISLSRARLERNFEILTELRKYWPTLDIVFTRLRAFHRACHTLRESSFRMDQWMLRFLSEFARPMDDKEVVEETPSPSLLMM